MLDYTVSNSKTVCAVIDVGGRRVCAVTGGGSIIHTFSGQFYSFGTPGFKLFAMDNNAMENVPPQIFINEQSHVKVSVSVPFLLLSRWTISSYYLD